MYLIFDNGDARLRYLKESLPESILTSENVDDSLIYDLIIPIQGINVKNLIAKTNVSLFDVLNKYKINKVFAPKMLNIYYDVIPYLTDELVIGNSKLTVESMLPTLYSKLNRTLINMKIIILGYGFLGQVLTDYLIKLDSDVQVYSKNERDLKILTVKGVKTLRTVNNLAADVIINTIPANIVIKENVKAELFIDLASPPYGIDKDVSKTMDNYLLLPALPGKCLPKSAGELIGKTIADLND